MESFSEVLLILVVRKRLPYALACLVKSWLHLDGMLGGLSSSARTRTSSPPTYNHVNLPTSIASIHSLDGEQSRAKYSSAVPLRCAKLGHVRCNARLLPRYGKARRSIPCAWWTLCKFSTTRYLDYARPGHASRVVSPILRHAEPLNRHAACLGRSELCRPGAQPFRTLS